MDYVFLEKSKKITLGIGVIGLLLFVLGIAIDSNTYDTLVNEGHNYGKTNRIWVSLLTKGIFFFFISLAVLFFYRITICCGSFMVCCF